MHNRFFILFPVLIVLFILLYPVSSISRTAGTVKGKIRMYLFESGTGSGQSGISDIHSTVGDTISIDISIRNNQRILVSAIEVYLTVDDEYFDIVSQGTNTYDEYESQPMPFIQGNYFSGAYGAVQPYGNTTHGDSLTANDNIFDGWQLDYVEMTGPDVGFGRPSSNMSYGVVATFQLVAKAPCDSVTIKLDLDSYYMRISRYHHPYDNDSYFFQSFESCKISVSPVTINPPLPDIYMKSGTVNNSLDLDDHVNLASIPDSLFNWSASGNTTRKSSTG